MTSESAAKQPPSEKDITVAGEDDDYDEDDTYDSGEDDGEDDDVGDGDYQEDDDGQDEDDEGDEEDAGKGEVLIVFFLFQTSWSLNSLCVHPSLAFW